MALRLPPGPSGGRLAQTVALHRDPLGWLREQQRRYGDVFTIRLLTPGPTVVCASPDLAATLPGTDGAGSHAGEARRGVLPQASARSSFGADGDAHRAARARIAPAFAPERVEALRPRIRAVAAAHVARMPAGRPFRLLPRMRALADEVFVRTVLEVRDEDRVRRLVGAIGTMLHTPGNPPVTLPAPGDGLAGRLIDADFRRRRRRHVADVLEAELEDRRAGRLAPGDGVLSRLAAAEPRLPAEAVVDELLAVVMAAQEPMAAALTWCALHLAHAPAGTVPDDAFRWEALRCNPAALGSLRTLTAPAAGLPAGAATMVPIPLVQRDARSWPDPDRFDPGRGLGDEVTGRLLPFGGGARRCVGQPLAWAELQEVLPLLADRGLRAPGRAVEPMVLRATILVPRRSGVVLVG